MEAILEMNGLSKSFKGKPVLRQIDLSISKGRVVGLLGKNGSGKTTLLKCALGLLKVSSGTSRLLGDDSWNLSGETKARIGYVPQKIELYAWMSVWHMITYIAAFYPRWNPALVESLVNRWELGLEDRVGKLSEGQLQKLGLILAMGHEPELLVLDEPAASLDPLARRNFLASVVEIAADANRTVILSTHSTTDLERVASDVALLKSGVINYAGPIDELKDSVKALRLSARRALPRRFDIPGLLNAQGDEHDALLTLRGVDAGLIERLETEYAATVEVRDLNLEDIFVEVHRD